MLAPCPHWNGSTPRRCATPSRRSATRCGHTPGGSTGSTCTRFPTATPARTWRAPSTRSSRRWSRRARATSTPTCDAISHGSLMGARGNSGVILSQILRGFASTLKGTAPMRTGHQGRRGAAGGGGRRIPGGAQADRGNDPDGRPRERPSGQGGRRRRRLAGRGASAPRVTPGKRALDNTPEQLPVLKEAGVVDAGGAGFLLLLDSALHVVDGDAAARAGRDVRRRAAPARAVRRRSPTARRRRTANSTSASSATR